MCSLISIPVFSRDSILNDHLRFRMTAFQEGAGQDAERAQVVSGMPSGEDKSKAGADGFSPFAKLGTATLGIKL